MSSGHAKIGHPAPNFKATAVMPDGQFKDISLSDYKGKYVVFFFYPLDFTFVCPTEIIAFSDRAEEFKKLNCQVIGASVDSHFCHLAWINTPKKQGGLGPMNIPLVSDPKRTIAQVRMKNKTKQKEQPVHFLLCARLKHFLLCARLCSEMFYVYSVHTTL
uniref:Peroxiredoxin-1 n=1 Tax=Molossus molossus TaxID=27622 RepID=A0A7J8FB43_MOLMO|nr:peroxiredoxin 1 [Molossus molossus]